MPAEKSKDFGGIDAAARSRRMRPERLARRASCCCSRVVSVTLVVLGPQVLGHATDIIVDGRHQRRSGIDFGAAAPHAAARGVASTSASAVLAYLQAYILAGVVQRTMYRLRADVEDKLNRLPLGYVDRQPRGDLLSRVTNDIDNLAQSLQQTLSQMLTSMLHARRRR